MIDINILRKNPELVKSGIKKKGYDPSLVDEVLKLDSERVALLHDIEQKRAEKNKLSEEYKEENIEPSKELTQEIEQLEPGLKELEEKYLSVLNRIPNLPADDVPVGKNAEENVVVGEVGEIPNFSFTPKDHVELGKDLDIIDFEAGAKVAGSGFYYLKNEGALLEIALVHYGLDFLIRKGFTPISTPDLSQKRFYEGTGYLPKGPEAQTYVVNDNDLGLIATAEVTLAGYHADETFDKKDLPKKYAGYSHCFRIEAGSYGKYSKGIYRGHQFTKVEMFGLMDEEYSIKFQEELLELEEEFWQSMNIPYRVVKMCTADLGAQAARKIDLEAWMPGRGDFGEVTSTSNTTDYQARNLNIKYRDGNETKFVHTLNGTLVAVPRAIISILENNQQEDGSVIVPEVLRPYMGKDKISK